MKTKLVNLAGAEEALPKKVPEFGGTHADVCIAIGHNLCLDQLSQVSIEIDLRELGRLIMLHDDICLSDHLAANAHKFIKIVKE